jgi:hypothetical protein
MKDRVIVPLIFFCSFSSLAYEILLTRIFSISLWYHFAFMIISIAMLGIGASGTILALYPKLRNLTNLGHYTLFLGAAICLSYLLSNQISFDPVRLSWSRVEILKIGLYYITLSIPFFFAGLTVASAFSSLSKKSGLIYGADLLGAGAGSAGILCLLTVTAPEDGVFILSSIVLILTCLTGKMKLKLVAFALITLNLLFLFFHPEFIKPRMSQYKELQMALRYPGAEHLSTYFSPFSRIDIFKSPAVRFAPGISLTYLDTLPQQIGISTDGGEINAITTFDDINKLSFLEYLPSALAYETGNKEDVLIIDPKGGLQALVASHFGSKHLYKVESNSLLMRVVRDKYRDFSRDIFGNNTSSGLARSWLKSRGIKFDIIDISLMGVSSSGSLGIAEDYRFTVEAFREYIARLKAAGILSINLYISPPPKTELRLLHTIITAFEDLGINDAASRIAAIRSWGNICILIKEMPFTREEIRIIKEFSKNRRFDLIHLPGIKEEETNIYIRTPRNEYFSAFRSILSPETREEFLERYIFDVRAVRDDRPFSHYYLKFKNIKTVYNIMGEKWQYFMEEGFILPALFVQVLFFSLLLMLVPALTKKKGNRIKTESARWFLWYFALLGIGFMFIEISFIQKIILLLENPSYAVAVLLTSILISSGIGSLLSYRTSIIRMPHALIVIALLVIAYSVFLPDIIEAISTYSMPVKIISVFFIFMPPGILMGIPFPTGLKVLGQIDESSIPWAWAINGCFSVLAPVLAVLLAIMTGFKTVLWLGAAAYLAAFFIFAFQSLRPSEQKPLEPSE